MFLLNGLQFHDEPTETPLVDSTEVWNLINLTPLTHPIHLHLVQFRVLQRRAFNITSFVKGEEPQYLGEPRLPDLNEQGWKDTVRSNPGDVTTILVHFPVRASSSSSSFASSSLLGLLLTGSHRRDTWDGSCGTATCWSTRTTT